VNVHENCFHLWQLAPGGYAAIKVVGNRYDNPELIKVRKV
jgi:hypothetical protein